MSADDHGRWRELLGSYVLGHLPAEETEEVREHVRSCEECRAEADALTSVARAMSKADPARLEEGTVPPPDLGDRILQAATGAGVTSIGTRMRFARGAVAGLAAAALLIVGFILFRPGGDPTPAAERISFASAPEGVDATAEIVAMEGATQVELQVTGLPPGEYAIQLERADGTEIVADSFQAPRGSWHGKRTLQVPRAESVAIKVVQIGGDTEMETPLPPVSSQ